MSRVCVVGGLTVLCALFPLAGCGGTTPPDVLRIRPAGFAGAAHVPDEQSTRGPEPGECTAVCCVYSCVVCTAVRCVQLRGVYSRAACTAA